MAVDDESQQIKIGRYLLTNLKKGKADIPAADVMENAGVIRKTDLHNLLRTYYAGYFKSRKGKLSLDAGIEIKDLEENISFLETGSFSNESKER